MVSLPAVDTTRESHKSCGRLVRSMYVVISSLQIQRESSIFHPLTQRRPPYDVGQQHTVVPYLHLLSKCGSKPPLSQEFVQMLRVNTKTTAAMVLLK